MSTRQLRNYTEEAVKTYIDRWFPETDICQCDDCRLDVMAIMLNNLTPQYVVTEKGALFAQMGDFDPQKKVDLMSNMSHAVNMVRERPSHNWVPKNDK